MDPDLGHFQPMVALLCGHGKIHNQFLTEGQRWVSDPDPKAVCTKERLEILEYCRKVYPKRDIRNIVENMHYFKVSSWCKVGQKRCKGAHWVKPFRCLEGPFQSDALLVPEHCLFDHIHNQSICQSFDQWNWTAAHSCQARSMRLRSFAMLLPCGVDIFSGVEFVCCPKEDRANRASKDEDKSNNASTGDDDDDYYEDDYSDEDREEIIAAAPATTTTERPVDYYFSHFDSKHEHESFKEAQRNLEEGHRERVTKVMKEWSELEEHYQHLKQKDPKGAEDFRKRMSARFQKTVESLEEEGAAEKHQLAAMHQQRVLTIINMRKKSAMDCYTGALEQTPPKTKKIEKCLEKVLRALEKDRTHMLHHYRHLLSSNGKQALQERGSLLEHLNNLQQVANQSIAMLDKVPSVADKIRNRMLTLWHGLRGLTSDPTALSDEAILDHYQEELDKRQKEHERQHKAEAEQRQQLKEMQDEKKRVEANHGGHLERVFDSESMEDESMLPKSTAPSTTSKAAFGPQSNAIAYEQLPTPKMSNMQKQLFHQNEAGYSIHKEGMQKFKWNGSVYITLAFAGVALLTAMIVGVVLLRRHAQRSPQSQGFVEVDQAASPEERHVANMQINGYENPTYKYFESHTK